MCLSTRVGAVIALALLFAFAACAAPTTWVVALDKAQDKAPVVLVLQDRDGKLTSEAFLSPLDAKAATTDVSKLTRTDDTLKGDVTVTIAADKTGTYTLDGTVKDNILTGSYKGKTGDTEVAGTISWGQELLPLGHALFLPSATRPVGFRGDNTGCFTAATPVSSWVDEYGTKLGKNVIWKTPMPCWTNSSPIVVGNKVFTNSEPDMLICTDAETGKILWQKQVDHLILWPEAEAKQAREDWKAQLAINYEYWSAFTEQKILRQWTSPSNKTPKVVPDLEARQNRFKQLMTEKGYALGDNNGGMSSGYDMAYSIFPTTGAGRSEYGKIQVGIRAKLYEKYGFNFEQWRGWIGQTMRTPTSDGQYVYVAMGFGQVACYDLDGNLKWMQWLKPGGKGSKGEGQKVHPGQETSSCPSPLLFGDKLIVLGGGDTRANLLTAFDKTTGKLLWQTKIGSIKRDSGSPMGMKVGDVEYIILAQGRVVRASDGVITDTDTIKTGGTRIQAMAISGNRAFFNWDVNHDGKPKETYVDAVDINAQGVGTPVWRAQVPSAMFCGVTAYKDYVYTPAVGIFGSMFAIQQADGKVSAVNYPAKPLPRFATYSNTPPSAVGEKLYWVNGHDGSMLVTSTGAALSQLGMGRLVSDANEDLKNLLAKEMPTLDEYIKKYGIDKDIFPGTFVMEGGPFFQGNRVYMRTREYLYCIGDATQPYQSPSLATK